MLNSVRLLTRIIPYIFEDPDWRGFFWSSVPGESPDQDSKLAMKAFLGLTEACNKNPIWFLILMDYTGVFFWRHLRINHFYGLFFRTRSFVIVVTEFKKKFATTFSIGGVLAIYWKCRYEMCQLKSLVIIFVSRPIHQKKIYKKLSMNGPHRSFQRYAD